MVSRAQSEIALLHIRRCSFRISFILVAVLLLYLLFSKLIRITIDVYQSNILLQLDFKSVKQVFSFSEVEIFIGKNRYAAHILVFRRINF